MSARKAPLPRMLVAAALAAAAVLGGCRAPPLAIGAVRVVYEFKNVRQVGDFDEWREISKVLASHDVAKPPESPVPERLRVFGSMRVQDYTAPITVAVLTDVEAIHGELDRLAKERFGRETIEYQLTGATAALVYRSNYVTAGIEIEISGFTDPGATLTILLHSGEEQRLDVGADGSWRARIKIAPNRRHVYGYSADRASGVRKHFRIDVFTQQQEPLAAADFARLQSSEP